MDLTYFAALPPGELADAILGKVDDFYQTIRTNGRLELWQTAYRHYYGMDNRGRHVSARPATVPGHPGFGKPLRWVGRQP